MSSTDEIIFHDVIRGYHVLTSAALAKFPRPEDFSDEE